MPLLDLSSAVPTPTSRLSENEVIVTILPPA